MNNLLRDIRLALRLVAKDPLFTGVVVVTLALGIGLNSAVFSTVDALLLRPLPGTRDPGELVQAYRKWPGMAYGSNSLPHWLDVKDRSKEVFSDVAAWGFMPMNISVDGKPTRVMGQVASANFFDVLGVRPMLGRTFVPVEDTGRRAHPVVVLSHSGWVRSFGADSGVIGRKVILDGESYEVIGVAPEGFKGGIPLVDPALWAPLTQIDHLEPGSNRWESRGNNSYNVLGRLKPGVTYEQAALRMDGIIRELRELYPDEYKESGITLVRQSDAGIHPMFRDAQVGLSAVVMGVVFLLLLIACVNVANLMLARARDRSREMAVRLSLGADRRILIRQLLTESLVLAALAGGAGLRWPGPRWVWRRAVSGVRGEIPINADLHLSPLVLVFTLGVSLVTGVLFGLAPQLQSTRPELVPALKGEAPAGGPKSRASRGLVLAQMALSIVLLVSAGLFLRNLEAVTKVDKGFQPENLLVADVDPALQGYSRARTEDFYRRLDERLEALPGVRTASRGSVVPLGLNTSDWGIEVPGYQPAPDESMSIYIAEVAPGYLEALGTPLLAGRDFGEQDDSAAARVLIINRRFAERFWPGQDPIGRTVRLGGRDHTVIGMTNTGKYVRLGETPTAYMYVPQAQHWSSGMSVVIRTAGDPQALIADLRREVAALDPDLPLSNVQSMTNRMGLAFLPARLAAAALGVFGVLGLVLASLGVYGVMSRSVAARRREIGIRLAIGAAGGTVVGLLLRDGLKLVAVGMAIGVVGALAGHGCWWRALRQRARSADLHCRAARARPRGHMAIWIPARRAAMINPVAVLRPGLRNAVGRSGPAASGQPGSTFSSGPDYRNAVGLEVAVRGDEREPSA
ncbi:MAG: ABC transporter permease [Gemmatimonadales bacterium]